MRKTFLIVLAGLLSANAGADSREISFRTADGLTVVGDVYPAAGGRSAPLVLLFHQAGGDARGEYRDIAMRLVAAGFNAVAIDQRSGGDQFGFANRTVALLGDDEFAYCDVYADLEAALDYARSAGFDGPVAAWGSSYSAALVFQLAAKRSGDLDAILAFSPAAGAPLADCDPEAYLADVDIPALALRPAREVAIDRVREQLDRLAAAGVETYVSDPGVHGSSMLDHERVGASTETTWQVVLEFLGRTLGGSADPAQRE